MRIAAKLTLALVAAVAILLTVQAWFHVRGVLALQERETRHDLVVLARALAEATGAIWSSQGERGARRYLERADEERALTRVSLRGSIDGAEGVPERVGDALVVYAPVEIDGQRRAFVELQRALGHEADYRALVWSQAGLTATLVLLSSVAVMFLGVWLIGRPVETLIGQARRVARGDFETSGTADRRDEIGRLGVELDLMTAELARTHKQLAEQRRARTALQDELRHADRLSTVGKVASGIAHELGTPLNVVAGRAAMIAAETTDEAIAESARIIAEQAQRMTQIIRDLLDFSRSRVVQKRRIAVGEVVEQATTLVEPIAESRNVRLAVEVPAELTADLDVGKTLQVLTNLMMNAVQAMPEGGTLTLSARSCHVAEPPDDHAEPGDYLALEVRDEGIGIPAEDLEHIFRPFFTTKRAGKGTGLGLYVCHGIVREQGGWIEVKSQPGEGSCFTVYLPYDEDGGST